MVFSWRICIRSHVVSRIDLVALLGDSWLTNKRSKLRYSICTRVYGEFGRRDIH
ncbi:hypothetical protein HanHA300_Chr12g0431771 [Helianthus annuus]|nr:hypothetical protein HanHA300_Chr12g0431771 [Helianthus annuus]KAJ0504172.1 hypothetical protein HanHA89_Chr12g0456351 [Helianthus annuus]KAJ0673875.1 hypothetical protein HanLR1_Chr12g0433781 [Helianthus annuus]